MSDSRRPLVLLALGAALGLALAVGGIVRSTTASRALHEDSVASVNGVSIRADAYRRLIAGLESDLDRGATDEEHQRVLDRMIEEELLVQRGLELGLARYDRRVRADLVSAMIESVTAEAEAEAPTEPELRDFFEREREFFTRPGRLRVRQVFFRVPSAEAEPEVQARAQDAARRLRAGETFERVDSELGDRAILILPDTALPATKLREYLGPTALRASYALEPGQVSEPVRTGTGIHVLELLERESDSVPPFEDVREQVHGEWRRRQGERALRDYLDDLRAAAEVETASAR